MLFYPAEVPALFSLVWSSGGFSGALTIGALVIASVLALLALRDRWRCATRATPPVLVPRPARTVRIRPVDRPIRALPVGSD